MQKKKAMRLIDLNEIDVFNQSPEDVVFDVIHAKPVDAVTVEWIEKRLEEEKDFFKRVNSPKHKWECEQRIYCLRDLLIDWRSENE